MYKYCLKCMELLDEKNMCPNGCAPSNNLQEPHRILPGTILNNKYIVGQHIGQGGFGITYIGRDLTLDRIVAIKEYYPANYVNRNIEVSQRITVYNSANRTIFEKGKEKFLEEAKVLAKFYGTPGVVGVIEHFEVNDTAYIVMEYLDGITLRTYLKKYGRFSAKNLFEGMKPIFDILEKVHNENIIHRDISPDNIMFMKDGTLKLLDFGAARHINHGEEKTASVVIKQGYAPVEQYFAKGMGPWTDIYALCATIYHCITGVMPNSSLERIQLDEIEWPSSMGTDITKNQEEVLRKGLEIYKENRFQNIKEIKEKLYGLEEKEFWDIGIAEKETCDTKDTSTRYLFGDLTEVLSNGLEEEPEEEPKEEPKEELKEEKEPVPDMDERKKQKVPFEKKRIKFLIIGVLIAIGVFSAVVVDLIHREDDNIVDPFEGLSRIYVYEEVNGVAVFEAGVQEYHTEFQQATDAEYQDLIMVLEDRSDVLQGVEAFKEIRDSDMRFIEYGPCALYQTEEEDARVFQVLRYDKGYFMMECGFDPELELNYMNFYEVINLTDEMEIDKLFEADGYELKEL